MAITKTLGGERLGGENQMKVHLHNFGRSSHDIGRVIKTDQATGTLVPYLCDIATNGTTYYIDIETKVRTLPTNGPIFGRFKHQIDVFCAPIRLYIAALHNNALGVGLKMQDIKLPMIKTLVPNINFNKPNPNAQQLSQDCLLTYLGIRGLGTPSRTETYRQMPAIFLMMYWDVYKNYYANKQEEIGVYIAGENKGVSGAISHVVDGNPRMTQFNEETGIPLEIELENKENNWIDINQANLELKQIEILGNGGWYEKADERDWKIEQVEILGEEKTRLIPKTGSWYIPAGLPVIRIGVGIELKTFELSNIDYMRENILAAPKTTPFIVHKDSLAPYNACMEEFQYSMGERALRGKLSQCGLGVKTYLSDRFNNWLSTEWIDGENGINEITSIDVSDGKLNMNDLILQKKIFDMLNRIAISGGSYNDWQEAVYGEKTIRMAESPIYCGGLSSDISFAEVVSSSDTEVNGEAQPLGSLAGRGVDYDGKGGKNIKVKVSEPSMLMVIGSITPRVDYSQGNKWWNKLETMDDLHKPNLDAIGFQELPTDEICAWDVTFDEKDQPVYNSAGKQPSWIEYMTAVDESFGSFSAEESLEYMALNRAYQAEETGGIKDLTTYIDPVLYNKAFAQADLTAKNFWIQVGFNITARRKMSAKQIPNL